MILQGVLLQAATSKTTAIWGYRLNYIDTKRDI